MIPGGNIERNFFKSLALLHGISWLPPNLTLVAGRVLASRRRALGSGLSIIAVSASGLASLDGKYVSLVSHVADDGLPLEQNHVLVVMVLTDGCARLGGALVKNFAGISRDGVTMGFIN